MGLRRQSQEERETALSFAKISDTDRMDTPIEGLESHLRHLDITLGKIQHTNRTLCTVGQICQEDQIHFTMMQQDISVSCSPTIMGLMYEEFSDLSPGQWIQRQKRLVQRIIFGSESIPEVATIMPLL